MEAGWAGGWRQIRLALAAVAAARRLLRRVCPVAALIHGALHGMLSGEATRVHGPWTLRRLQACSCWSARRSAAATPAPFGNAQQIFTRSLFSSSRGAVDGEEQAKRDLKSRTFFRGRTIVPEEVAVELTRHLAPAPLICACWPENF